MTSLQIGLTLNFYFLKYLLQSYVNQHIVILFGRHSWNSNSNILVTMAQPTAQLKGYIIYLL